MEMGREKTQTDVYIETASEQSPTSGAEPETIFKLESGILMTDQAILPQAGMPERAQKFKAALLQHPNHPPDHPALP